MNVWVPDDLLQQRLGCREEGGAEVTLKADNQERGQSFNELQGKSESNCIIYNTGTQERMKSGYHTRLNNQTPWKIHTDACLLSDLRNLCSGLMQKTTLPHLGISAYHC
jgi:hypothetical protein